MGIGLSTPLCSEPRQGALTAPPCAFVESKCELTVPTQAAAPSRLRTCCSLGGNGRAPQRADSISTLASWTSTPPRLPDQEEVEVAGHPDPLGPLPALAPPDGQVSSGHHLPTPPCPQSPFPPVAVCWPFLLGHKSSLDRHCVLFANTGARVHRGGEGEASCSLFSHRPLLSPFQSPPGSLSLNVHTKIKKQLLIRARE